MAGLIILALVTAVAGTVLGAYFKICFAIRQEDRKKWSLRSDAPSPSARTARTFVGISGSRWN